MKSQSKKQKEHKPWLEFIPLYKLEIFFSPEDKCYIVNVPELKGCKTHGETHRVAVEMAYDAIETYLESLSKHNEEIPVPLAIKNFSGNIMLRTSPEKHRDLVVKAELEGESLNSYMEKKLFGT